MWSASDWERPLSPLSKGRRCNKHASGLASIAQQNSTQHDGLPSRPQTQQDVRRHTVGGSQHLVHYGQDHAMSRAQEPLLAASAPSTPTGARTHTTHEIRPSTAGSQLTVHYLGIARGELGVLSKKQEIPERPVTAPAEAKRAAKVQPGWQPIYHTQDAVEQYKRGTPSRDMRAIVDNPVGKSTVQHSKLPSHGLQLVVAVRPHRCAIPSSWNALPANKNLTARWHGRVLSAGGFPGWKLSHGGRGGFTKCRVTHGGLLPVSKSGVECNPTVEEVVDGSLGDGHDAGQDEEPVEDTVDDQQDTAQAEPPATATPEPDQLLVEASISANAPDMHQVVPQGLQERVSVEVVQAQQTGATLDKPADGFEDD